MPGVSWLPVLCLVLPTMKTRIPSKWTPSFTWTDVEILLCIATLNQSEGAKLPKIIECIDYRQKMILTDEELHGGLERLEGANFIEKRDGEYFVTEALSPNLPRTAKGRLSWKKRDWYQLLGVERAS